jgi:hypothetical protein
MDAAALDHVEHPHMCLRIVADAHRVGNPMRFARPESRLSFATAKR